MSFWNGAFDRPDILKHRDYQHNSFAEHVLDNFDYEVIGNVRVHSNPLTEQSYEQNRTFYIVRVKLEDRDIDYLIPMAHGGGPPKTELIQKWINAYNENPVEGGRRLEYYVTDGDLETLGRILNG